MSLLEVVFPGILNFSYQFAILKRIRFYLYLKDFIKIILSRAFATIIFMGWEEGLQSRFRSLSKFKNLIYSYQIHN